MSNIPAALLRVLYNRSSLNSIDGVVSFSLSNRISPASIQSVQQVTLNSRYIPLNKVSMSIAGGEYLTADQLSSANGLEFPLAALLRFKLEGETLEEGDHKIELLFDCKPFGYLKLEIKDSLKGSDARPGEIPRNAEDDFAEQPIQARQQFIHHMTGAVLEHISQYSIDPHTADGNIEHFTGAVQVPLGFAGPLLVNGEHAQGEYYVPMATSEGTLVASYNRGMKVLHACGGVKCTVVGDSMQRAPVFVFEDAHKARLFADWIVVHMDEIRTVAEATDPFIKLKYVDYYLAIKFAYLRFNYTTGDAGGQNMVGKATFAACNWILQNCDVVEIQRFFLDGNFATDKKASMINMMRTRGKRVTAEVVIKREVLLDIMHADTESLYAHSKVANIGSMLSGANNNGCHSANAITAVFMATGQDVANVSESSVALLYLDLLENKDLYISITLPSLIVATCGGGTGLPTQRESLQALDCYGVGKVKKFAEIVAGTVLAGEISLAAAISSLDWVSSHEKMGRNDPGKKKT
ncbi:MAG: hydroxymethylglutaryl-CoA reductase [Proteobacteria bacterium]|nr:hydroxymethylglutaryl-CoA reductase [Pseudomonadota bacterium]